MRTLDDRPDEMHRRRVDGGPTLSLHRDGILAYYDVPISTGAPEGTNNKMHGRKQMKSQKSGYPSAPTILGVGTPIPVPMPPNP